MTPVQRRCRVVLNEPLGAYRRIGVAAPELARRARAGQFLAARVGGPSSSLLLRRALALYAVDGDVVEVVVAAHGPGTRWLVDQPVGAWVDVVGPLGRAFPAPGREGPVVVVGGGYGTAALVWLVEGLRRDGRPVSAVVGAAAADRLVGVGALEAFGAEVLVATDDGSAGTRGLVTDLLAGSALAALRQSAVVYACGPMAMLEATARTAQRAGVPSWCSVEESMACGIGVCMTCVLPVVGDDGLTRMVRSCVEGPTFAGAAVRWAEVGTVPADCVGATATGAGH